MPFQQKIHQIKTHSALFVLCHFDSKINKKKRKLSSEIFPKWAMNVTENLKEVEQANIVKHVPLKNPANYMCTTKEKRKASEADLLPARDHQSFKQKQ